MASCHVKSCYSIGSIWFLLFSTGLKKKNKNKIIGFSTTVLNTKTFCFFVRRSINIHVEKERERNGRRWSQWGEWKREVSKKQRRRNSSEEKACEDNGFCWNCQPNCFFFPLLFFFFFLLRNSTDRDPPKREKKHALIEL